MSLWEEVAFWRGEFKPTSGATEKDIQSYVALIGDDFSCSRSRYIAKTVVLNLVPLISTVYRKVK